ncbi:MAG: tetratricopeptide repeat protein [Alphaproteobacteria bacterium]
MVRRIHRQKILDTKTNETPNDNTVETKKTSLVLNLATNIEFEEKKENPIVTSLLKRGSDFFDKGDFKNAYNCFFDIIRYEPNNYIGLHKIGCTCWLKGEHDQALKYLEKTVAINPYFLKAQRDLIFVAKNMMLWNKVISVYENLLKIEKNNPSILNDYASDLAYMGKNHEAIAIINNLIASNQQKKALEITLAKCYEAVGENEKAVKILENLASSNGELKDEAAWFLSRHLLQNGQDLARGFELYEQGLNTKFRNPKFIHNVKVWNGEDLAGKTIVILNEQGIDETVLFSGNIPEITASAKKVFIESDELLHRVFKRSFKKAEIISDASELTGIDYQCPFGSLNKIMFNKKQKIDFPKSYMLPNLIKAKDWEISLKKADQEKPKIGICWRNANSSNLYQSGVIDILDFASFADIKDDVFFINLQQDDSFAETALLEAKYGIKIKTITASKNDLDDPFDEALSLLTNFDLVISIRSGSSLLSSSLGIETWLLEIGYDDNDNKERLPLDLPNVKRFIKHQNETWESVIKERLFPAFQKKLAAGFENKKTPIIEPLPAKELEEKAKKLLLNNKLTTLDIYKNIHNEASLLNIDDAEYLLKAFLENFPNFIEATSFLGKIAFYKKDYIQAKQYLQSITVNNSKKDIKPYLKYLAEILPEDNQENEEKSALKDETNRDSVQEASSSYLLDDIEKNLAEEKWTAAFNIAKDCYQKSPDNEDVVISYIEILLLFGKAGAAQTIYQNFTSKNKSGHKLSRLAARINFLASENDNYFSETVFFDDDNIDLPLWQGEDISNQTIYVSKSFNLGDEIKASNFYNFVIRSSKKCIIECSPELLSVFELNFTKAEFVTSYEASNIKADVKINADNLINIFYQKEKSISFRNKFIKPSSKKAYYWKKNFTKINKQPKIGIYYEDCDNFTRFNYDNLEDLLKIEGLTFINLSKNDLKDIHKLDINIMDDLEECSSILTNLDLIITTDNPIAEFAAALGVETLIIKKSNLSNDDLAKLKQLYPENVTILLSHTSKPSKNFVTTVLAKKIEEDPRFRGFIITANRKRLELDKPNTISQLYQKASVLKNGNEFKDAKIILDVILSYSKDQPESLLLYASIAKEERDFEKQEDYLKRVLKNYPDNITAISEIAVLYAEKGRFEELGPYITKIINSGAKDCKYYHDVSAILTEAGRIDDVQALLTKCLELNPNHYETLVNLATPYFYSGNIDKGKALLKQAHNQNSADIKAQWNMATKLIYYEDSMAEGLKYYEAGLGTKARQPYRTFGVPQWNGEDISDKKLLVWREQGIGDEIYFAVYYNEAIKAAKACILEVEPRLVSLFKRSFPEAAVMAQPLDLSKDIYRRDFDIHCPAASIRYIHYKKFNRLNNYEPYLIPDEVEKQNWKEKLESISSKPKVGICWRSGLLKSYRSVLYGTIEDYAELFKNDNVDFVNLQYDDCQEELDLIKDKYGVTIYNPEGINQKNEIDRVASLMSNLDLVISAQTAVDSIANGLGIPTWSVTAYVNNQVPTFSNTPLYSKSRFTFQKPAESTYSQLVSDYIKPQLDIFLKNLKK